LSFAGIGKDDTRGRRSFDAWTDGQALACADGTPEELEAEWKRIRRGWYMGGESFKDRLMDCIGEKLHAREPDSQAGDAKRDHGISGAQRWLDKAIKQLEVTERELTDLPKGDPAKQALAWGLRTGFRVSNKWVALRLHMGDPSRVSAAVAEVRRATKGRLARLRREMKARLIQGLTRLRTDPFT